jgi:hypothetical protein
MLLLAISVTSVLWALVWLCIAVALVYIIIWVFGKLGIAIPANVVMIIKVVLILLALIFIINYFFMGGGGHGIGIRP